MVDVGSMEDVKTGNEKSKHPKQCNGLGQCCACAHGNGSERIGLGYRNGRGVEYSWIDSVFVVAVKRVCGH